jgi:catechol 2,3-dioxygenase-like lactoylglutathione lyase family enzyme
MMGMHHIALSVKDMAACEYFYVDLLGMKIDWRPDADNLYLSSGTDNVALHQAPADFAPSQAQRVHHIGFFLKVRADVDAWYEFLESNQVVIKAKPKNHRDGTASFYCLDPDENIIQLIYYPQDKYF